MVDKSVVWLWRGYGKLIFVNHVRFWYVTVVVMVWICDGYGIVINTYVYILVVTLLWNYFSIVRNKIVVLLRIYNSISMVAVANKYTCMSCS